MSNFVIQLLTERGELVEELTDPQGLLDSLLPTEYSPLLLGGLDRYGDTTFNWIQMKAFLIEWEGVEAKASTEEEKRIVAEVKRLALRCREGNREYLKFLGD